MAPISFSGVRLPLYGRLVSLGSSRASPCWPHTLTCGPGSWACWFVTSCRMKGTGLEPDSRGVTLGVAPCTSQAQFYLCCAISHLPSASPSWAANAMGAGTTSVLLTSTFPAPGAAPGTTRGSVNICCNHGHMRRPVCALRKELSAPQADPEGSFLCSQFCSKKRRRWSVSKR